MSGFRVSSSVTSQRRSESGLCVPAHFANLSGPILCSIAASDPSRDVPNTTSRVLFARLELRDQWRFEVSQSGCVRASDRIEEKSWTRIASNSTIVKKKERDHPRASATESGRKRRATSDNSRLVKRRRYGGTKGRPEEIQANTPAEYRAKRTTVSFDISRDIFMQPTPFSRREIADVVPSISTAGDVTGDNRNRRVKWK